MTFSLDLTLLADLCALPGISGFEGPVVSRLQEHLVSRGIEQRVDRIGNLVAHLPGIGPKVVLLVHTDEVGLLVRKVHPDGFLGLERVGGTSPHVLPGKRLQVWTEHGPQAGVVGALPMHLAANYTAPGLYEMYLDTGARSAAEQAACGISVGQPVNFEPAFEQANGRMIAKALDDRLGCFLLLELAERLLHQPAGCDLYLAFVVQEESMLSGGLPIVQELRPDWALGIDATLAFDTPDLKDGQTDLALGAGPAVKVMDKLRGSGLGFIAHQGLRSHMEALAVGAGLPFQREIVIGLSTAATPLPFAAGGLPAGALSFPLRYAHSGAEMVDLSDAQALAAWLEICVRTPWTAPM